MDRVTSRVNDPRRDENEQVLFLRPTGLAPEQSADERQISQHRHLVLCFFDIFGKQAAKHNRLTVPDDATRHHFAMAEDGQGNCEVTGVPTVLPLTSTIVGTNFAAVASS